jgi:hypothetical protein
MFLLSILVRLGILYLLGEIFRLPVRDSALSRSISSVSLFCSWLLADNVVEPAGNPTTLASIPTFPAKIQSLPHCHRENLQRMKPNDRRWLKNNKPA